MIVGFALCDGDGRVVELPAGVRGRRRALPMADPVVRRRAYALLGRPDRAALLDPA